MKKIIVWLVVALSGFALASPAQDVFDEVNYFLVLNYGGFSSANVRGFSDKYQPQIMAACMDRVDTCPAVATYPVIDTMMAELADKHTYFIPGAAARVRSIFAGTATNQSFGIRLTQVKNRVGAFVDDVVMGSSGQEAGIKRGDWLLGINGQTLINDPENIGDIWFAAQQSSDLSSLVISRQNKTMTVRLKPRVQNATELPNLSLRDDGVAILKIPTFALTPRVIGLAIHERVLEAQQKSAKAMIVDLRGNGGGVIVDAMAGVSAFLADGLERHLLSKNAFANFEAKYELGNITQIFNGKPRVLYTIPKPAKWRLPVAVLVNSQSASASEFFSLDFQNAKRGAVIGEVTKGVANTAISGFTISDGSFLFVTVAKNLRPDGTAFPEFVTPDVLVKDDLEFLNRTGHDALLEKALEIFKQ